MRKHLLAVILVLIFSAAVNGQHRTVRFFAGVTTLNELNAGIYVSDSQKTAKLDLEVGFVVPVKGEMKVMANEFIVNPFLQLNQIGPVLRFRYRDIFNDSSPTQFAISLDFYKLWSRNYLYDIGEYSGSSRSEYSEYKDELFVAGLTPALFFSTDNTDQSFWFIAPGVKYKWISRTYSVEGTYDNQIPSDRTEKINKVTPTILAGLRFYL